MELNELLKSSLTVTMSQVRDVLSSRAMLCNETHGEADLARLSAGSHRGPPACLTLAGEPEPSVRAHLQTSASPSKLLTKGKQIQHALYDMQPGLSAMAADSLDIYNTYNTTSRPYHAGPRRIALAANSVSDFL